ncbi:NADP-dependent oxidoreductase [Streptacidiphilus sp. PB12-B1b]|uniref:MDR family NADP-dependent oxidoreductase n=1 Tax=Streptacidiphilus sp. PB12-B1b TaxID=2705012 RepID=UPI0015FDBD97|nr:NADP-dependent oxidoreductase [Streptacidiphilus sp. PB12-B1b]QMU76945.1 NADP-dependent oxidoreductase [Streptacidiphilus sp. PB12-B1b]
MPVLPPTCREVRLAARPEGLPGPEHFEVVRVPLPAPGAGQVLVCNRFFRVSASLRMMISQGAQDVPGVPFPVLSPGDVLTEEAVGEVVSAPADSGLHPGDLVSHHRGWREYAVLDPSQCTPLDAGLPDPVAILGHGWTAYAALTRGVRIRPGDTVFVSAASSAIGSMAGQIARLLGAGRVVGSTGSPGKAERLVGELGYDAAVIRDAQEPLTAQLARATPGGVDVFLDTVGGEQLRAAVAAAREGARFVLVGALSGQLAARGTGRSAPVELDTFQILMKKITMRGYSADEDPQARPEWNQRFGAWLRSGEITFPHVRIDGIERAPGALLDVIHGRHLGTVVVEL